MENLQKLGAFAALTEAATFVLGFYVYFTLLAPANYGSALLDTAQHVAFLVENQTLMYTWNLIIYVLFGIMLIVLTLSLNERLKEISPVIMPLGTAFGLIWAGLVLATVGQITTTKLF